MPAAATLGGGSRPLRKLAGNGAQPAEGDFGKPQRTNQSVVLLKRYLLDTGSAADYLNRRGAVFARARQARAQGARLGLGAPVLGELWDGIIFYYLCALLLKFRVHQESSYF